MGWEIIPPSALIMTFIGAIPVAIYGVHYLFYPDQPRRVSQNAFSLAMESRDSRILHWIKDAKRIEKQQGK